MSKDKTVLSVPVSPQMSLLSPADRASMRLASAITKHIQRIGDRTISAPRKPVVEPKILPVPEDGA